MLHACCWSLRRSCSFQRSRLRPEPAPRRLSRRQGAGRRQAHRLAGRRPRVPRRRSRCRRWRGSWRRHYGFKCSVFFTTDPKTGFIEPGSSNISGLEALKTADLLVVFLRFQDFPDDRDAAHRRLPGSRRAGRRVSHRDARVSDQAAGREVPEVHVEQRGADYTGGFGRQILGETWVSHYGTQPQAELAAAAAGRRRRAIRSCAA